jgi:hypothetical protein
MHNWLLGRIAVMAINGALTAVGLWFLGIPMAIPLGIITGLLNFIPNIGPFLAAAPAILLAFTESPTAALYVAVLFFIIPEHRTVFGSRSRHFAGFYRKPDRGALRRRFIFHHSEFGRFRVDAAH